MTSPAGKSTSSSSKKVKQTAPPENPEDWVSRLAQFWFQIERFVWDVLGVILLALGVILLLGLLGLTRGSMLTPMIQVVDRGFGWGGFLVVAFISILGLFALRRRKQNEAPFPMKQLLLLEGWAFCLLALFTLLGGRSLDQAEQGYGGGLVGWGLVELVSKILPDPFLLVLFIALFVVFGLFGFGLTRRFSEWIDAWLATPDEPDLVDLAALTSNSTQSAAQGLSFISDPEVRKTSQSDQY